MLVRLGERRTAIELKYLVAALHATVDGELFDLPSQSAQDISRHDVIKDITRVEALLADRGQILVLSNDRSYWQQAFRTDKMYRQNTSRRICLRSGNVLYSASADHRHNSDESVRSSA
jgi:hypothetical protein